MIKVFEFKNVRRFDQIFDPLVQVRSESFGPPHGVYDKGGDLGNSRVTSLRGGGKLEVLLVRLDQRLYRVQVERGRISWCGGADEMCCMWNDQVGEWRTWRKLLI